MNRSTLSVALISPWHRLPIVKNGVSFNPNLEIENADAVLFEHSIDERLRGLRKPWAWYFSEPSWHSMYRNSTARRLRAQQSSHNLLYYAHPDTKYRIPHITCVDPSQTCRLMRDRNSERAIAIVSNHGGIRSLFQRDIRNRNAIVAGEIVDLYGRRDQWRKFIDISKWPPRRGAPLNYRGEINTDGGWTGSGHIEFMSRYKTAVVLENSIEPYYFTEKFINAVRAECIPIYHAHSTVAKEFLFGARWFDPADYNFDAEETIRAALSADRDAVAAQNKEWLASPAAQSTFFDSVWSRLADLFAENLGARRPL